MPKKYIVWLARYALLYSVCKLNRGFSMPSLNITPEALEHAAQALAQEVDVLFRSGVPIVAITTIDPLSTTRIIDQYVKTSADSMVSVKPSEGIMAWAYSHGFGRVDQNGIGACYGVG
jgi:hypothetical protein